MAGVASHIARLGKDEVVDLVYQKMCEELSFLNMWAEGSIPSVAFLHNQPTSLVIQPLSAHGPCHFAHPPNLNHVTTTTPTTAQMTMMTQWQHEKPVAYKINYKITVPTTTPSTVALQVDNACDNTCRTTWLLS